MKENKETFYNINLVVPSFILVDEIDSNNPLLNNLIKDVEEVCKNCTLKTNVVAKRSSFEALVNNNNFHSFLKLIKQSIQKIYKNNFIIQNAWGNIYSTEEDHALMHNHPDATAFSGLLYLTDSPGPGTFFKEANITIEEKKGRFVLFSNLLNHEVKKFKYNTPRITVAFNFSELKDWDNSNIHYVR